MTVDPANVAAFIKACAAEIVIPAFRNLESIEIGLKGPNDVVTEADIAAEAFLTPKLLDLLPGSVVVGEETAGEETAWRETLRGAPAVWLIDPIDGTSNFAAGIPLFGIMVALVEHGQTTHAWIYDPNTDEMATAQRGAGAWLGETRLTVATATEVGTMRGCMNTQFAAEEEAAQLFRAARHMQPTLELRCGANLSPAGDRAQRLRAVSQALSLGSRRRRSVARRSRRGRAPPRRPALRPRRSDFRQHPRGRPQRGRLAGPDGPPLRRALGLAPDHAP